MGAGAAKREYLAMAYGADATGVADSREAIQAAIYTRAQGSSRAVLALPPGRFLLSSPLLVPPSGLVLRCAGPGMTTLVQGWPSSVATETEGVIMTADPSVGAEGVVLEEFSVECSPLTGTLPNLSAWGQAIWFAGASDVWLLAIHASGGGFSFNPLPAYANTPDVNTTGHNIGVSVSECVVQGGAEGLYFQQGQDLVVRGNSFLNSYDSSLSINSSGEKIVIEGNVFDKQGNAWEALAHVECTNDGAGDTRGIRDLAINGNLMLNAANSASAGVRLTGVTHCAVTGNAIRNNEGTGIWASDGSNFLTISGNAVDQASTSIQAAIQLANDVAGMTAVTVTGNTAQNATVDANCLGVGGGSETVGAITIVGNILHSDGAASAGLAADAAQGLFAYNNGAGSTEAAAVTGTGWTSTGNIQ